MKLLLAFAILALSTGANCGIVPHVLYGKRIAGQVVDADTGQPIPGAYVAFVWESGIIPSGFTGHNSRDICYHAAAAVTDPAGRFEVAPWRKWSTYDVSIMDPLALVYVRGYVPRQIVLQAGPVKRPADRPIERYALKPFKGTEDERMHMLFWGLANHGCDYGGDSQESLYPMLKAVYDEARQIAHTQDDEDTVQIIAHLAAKAALAHNPNRPVNDEPLNDFIGKHLQ